MTFPYRNRSVMPSYLGSRTMGVPQDLGTFSTVQLLQGEVKEIIYPKDKRSQSQKYIEYRVDVQYRDGDGPATTVTFPNCYLINAFGGIADNSSYTLRADEKEPEGEEVSATGSKVLILCVNGDTSKAYIIGGIREDDAKEGETKEDGHHLAFEFNGVNFAINKNGEATLTFRGQTKVNGELGDDAVAEAEGTRIEINKEGNVTVATPEDKQFIRVNHKDKKLEILVDEEWNTEVNGKMVCTVEKNIDIESKSDKINLTAGSNVVVKSTGVLVGDATDKWLLASTYRQAESTMHNMMKSAIAQLNAAGSTLTTAGATIASGAGVIAGAASGMTVPIVGSIIAGPIIAGGAATVATGAGQVSAAAAQIIAAATQLTSAISSFEAQAEIYLSKKNKND